MNFWESFAIQEAALVAQTAIAAGNLSPQKKAALEQIIAGCMAYAVAP